MLLHEGHAPEEVAHQNEQTHPGHAADDVEERELGEVHVTRARNEGGEGAEERHEARDDDGQAAIALEEVIELGHALGSKGLHLPRIDDAAAEQAGDPIVRGIAQNGRQIEHDERGPQVQAASIGGEHASGEQKRVTGQKREEHQARLHEHDKE